MILYHSFIFPVSAEEQCLSCHIENSGKSTFHNPEEIGCTSFHAGKASEKNENSGNESRSTA
jgi:hypothetical protein